MTNTVGKPQEHTGANGHRTAAKQRLERPEEGRAACVSLRRLLGLATLTPTQAAHVAVEVLAQLDGNSGSYGAFTADDVLVGDGGDVRLADRDGEFVPGTTTSGAALLEQLARNADRPAVYRRREQAALLTVLNRCANDLRRGDLAASRADLRSELTAVTRDRDRLTCELAALVAVPLVRAGAHPASEPAGSATVAGAAPQPVVIVDPLTVPEQPAAAAAPPVAAPPLPPTAVGRRMPPRRVVWPIAAAVLAAVAALVAAVLTRSGGHGVPQPSRHPVAATHAPRPQPPAVAARADRPRAVPRPGPAAAGPIRKVTLDANGHCSPGRYCTVTVRVWLRPPGLSSLIWRATVVDRCTGGIRTLDRGSMIAEPGWRSAYTTVRLHLPHKRSIAVLAVVDSPVSVSSKPLVAPAGGGNCAPR